MEISEEFWKFIAGPVVVVIWSAILFTAGAIFGGFFQEVGRDAWKKLRRVRKPRLGLRILEPVPAIEVSAYVMHVPDSLRIVYKLLISSNERDLEYVIDSHAVHTVNVDPRSNSPIRRLELSGIENGDVVEPLKSRQFEASMTIVPEIENRNRNQQQLSQIKSEYVQYIQHLPANVDIKVDVAARSNNRLDRVEIVISVPVRQLMADRWLSFLGGTAKGDPEYYRKVLSPND